jgi:raffinose/stachyose/melibiose transport system permease protein
MNYKKVYPQSFLIPAILIYFALFLFPSVLGFCFSFTDWTVVSDKINFVGLDNFKEMFGASLSDTINSLRNTFTFAIFSTVFKIIIGFALALLLNKGLKTLKLLRAVFFLPIIISPVVFSVLFLSILHPTDGILNNFLKILGLGFFAKDWLIDTQIALWSCIGIEVWKASGFCMAIFLSGLQMIPAEVYESADMDGATGLQKTILITVPFLMPAITINVILNLISGFQVFDVIYTLTNGGPGGSTETLYITAFDSFSKGFYSLSSAQNFILFIIVSIVSVFVLRFFSRKENDLS